MQRKTKNNLFKILGFLCLLKIIGFVLILFGSIFWEGFGAFILTNLDPQTQETSTKFNWSFLFHGDSIDPLKAGLGSSLLGTLYLILIVFLIAVPCGIAAGIYLENFAPKRLRLFLQTIILNLASVPSIIYGFMGLILFIQFFHLPRSSALLGGIVLSLLVLPQLIVITEDALRAVPKALWDATLAMGATTTQALRHHILPWAFRPILTSIVLSLARIMGETAPLLMIGMVAFIANPQPNPLEPNSALPVQIFLWSKNPDPAFTQKTAGAILVLILLLLVVNSFVAFVRHKLRKMGPS